MSATSFMPVIVEATKFMFNEVSKWLDRTRQQSNNFHPESSSTVSQEKSSILTKQEFAHLEKNPADLMALINVQFAETNIYEIKSLVDQIHIHRKNLIDFEATEAEFGSLTPPHVKRGIDREASAIVEKSSHLKQLLEQVYGRKIQKI